MRKMFTKSGPEPTFPENDWRAQYHLRGLDVPACGRLMPAKCAIFRMIHQRLAPSQAERARHHRHHGGGRYPPLWQVGPWATGDRVHSAARELAGGFPPADGNTFAYSRAWQARLLVSRCGGRGPVGRGEDPAAACRPSPAEEGARMRLRQCVALMAAPAP
jgi:hypothetical protein